jgi:hypothetical protein
MINPAVHRKCRSETPRYASRTRPVRVSINGFFTVLLQGCYVFSWNGCPSWRMVLWCFFCCNSLSHRYFAVRFFLARRVFYSESSNSHKLWIFLLHPDKPMLVSAGTVLVSLSVNRRWGHKIAAPHIHDAANSGMSWKRSRTWVFSKRLSNVDGTKRCRIVNQRSIFQIRDDSFYLNPRWYHPQWWRTTPGPVVPTTMVPDARKTDLNI